MADISTRIVPVYEDGSNDHTALYAVKNATAGDTFNVGQRFSVVKRAGLVSSTGTTIAQVVFAGVVLTIPAGVTNDGVWVIVVGVAA